MPLYTTPTNLTGLGVAFIKISAVYHLFSTYVGYTAPTLGPSMLPTINQQGDTVWISSWHRRGRGIKAGDLISFRHPLVPGASASKRVLGMPGDWIVVDATEAGAEGRCLQVPEGHCWVEGDHSAWSRDSRIYGPLPLALVKGKVLARVYPFSQWKWISNPLEDGS